MIFDTLNNLPNYLGISPHLDTAIEYIMARDIATLPEGRTRVDGEAVTVEVRTLTPQSGEKADFVCREGCLTLLTDLAGSEMFEVSLGEFAVKKPAAGDAPAQDAPAGAPGGPALCGSDPNTAADAWRLRPCSHRFFLGRAFFFGLAAAQPAFLTGRCRDFSAGRAAAVFPLAGALPRPAGSPACLPGLWGRSRQSLP